MAQLTRIEQAGIFQGTIRQNGRLFHVCFIIVERGGAFRGKIISCEPLKTLGGIAATLARKYLPFFIQVAKPPESTVHFQRTTSSFSALEFLTSIQIRAPAYNA